MTTEQKVKQHNAIVKRQTRRSFAGFNPKEAGVLRKAPKGYRFDISNILVPQ